MPQSDSTHKPKGRLAAEERTKALSALLLGKQAKLYTKERIVQLFTVLLIMGYAVLPLSISAGGRG
jgi:hypothetical protein